jgi:hypothetical protein
MQETQLVQRNVGDVAQRILDGRSENLQAEENLKRE